MLGILSHYAAGADLQLRRAKLLLRGRAGCSITTVSHTFLAVTFLSGGLSYYVEGRCSAF